MAHQPKESSVSRRRKLKGKGLGDGFPSPDQIRMSIQSLVASDQIEEAQHLSQQGLKAYPGNEGVLAITSLLAVVREDWDHAVLLLERLIAVQGGAATDFTRDMYQRALRCSGKTQPDERQSLAGTTEA
jgi:hypothetical protein